MISKLPKISIVTISYNQDQFIEQTIKSVLDQDYPNLEYIIIDGGSSDSSVEIIRSYAERLHYWASEPDDGPASALNKGFRHATGEIYYYLNSDDILLPGTLDYVSKLFAKNEYLDVFYGHGYMADEKLEKRVKIFSNRWHFNLFVNGLITVIQPSTFFKGSFYRQHLSFDETNRSCWDAHIIALAGSKNAGFIRFNRFCSVFRFHTSSITGSNNASLEIQYDLDKQKIKQLNGGYISNVKFKTFRKIIHDPLILLQRIFSNTSEITSVRNSAIK